MRFRHERVSEFLELFERVAPQILSTPGCLSLEIWRGIDSEDTFSTVSRWTDAAALDRYRSSPLFQTTWSTIRPWFARPAEAESFEVAGGL